MKNFMKGDEVTVLSGIILDESCVTMIANRTGRIESYDPETGLYYVVEDNGNRWLVCPRDLRLIKKAPVPPTLGMGDIVIGRNTGLKYKLVEQRRFSSGICVLEQPGLWLRLEEVE